MRSRRRPAPRRRRAAKAPEVLAESLLRVPLLSNLPEADRDAIARLFTERTFAAGETVTKEGADAAAFYLIESGTATVTVGGAFRRTLGAGDHFGEIALIDGGARSATVTADGELVCQGITLWDFQPLVQRNPSMAWTLLQTLARELRQAGEPQTPSSARRSHAEHPGQHRHVELALGGLGPARQLLADPPEQTLALILRHHQYPGVRRDLRDQGGRRACASRARTRPARASRTRRDGRDRGGTGPP